MFKQIAVILFFIAFTIQCAAQDNATEFINITYKTLTGSSNNYFLREDKEAEWTWDKGLRDLVKTKCSVALPVNVVNEICDNIPTERIFEKWNCEDLINAKCVKEDSLREIKNRGEKIFIFENPVFNDTRTYAIVWCR